MSYTLTASQTGYVFTPLSRDYSSLSGDFSNQNFTATTYVVSGLVVNASGAAVSGVPLSLAETVPFTATTTAPGIFSFAAVPGQNIALIPTQGTAILSPVGLTIAPLNSNQLALTFTVINQTLRGTVVDGSGPSYGNLSSPGRISHGDRDGRLIRSYDWDRLSPLAVED